MENNENKKEERPILYIRLLSYANACKVIDFIKANNKEDDARITPGGVSTQVSPANWDKVIDFIDSLGVRYEIGKEHPEKVNSAILHHFESMKTMHPAIMKIAVDGYNSDESKEIIRRRHQIVLDYCKQKDWDADTAKLSIQQVMEIRAQQDWKDVPQKVKEEFKQA